MAAPTTPSENQGTPPDDPFDGEPAPPEPAATPEPAAQPAPPNASEQTPTQPSGEQAQPNEAADQYALVAQKAAQQALEQATAPPQRTLADVLAREQDPGYQQPEGQPGYQDPQADPYGDPYADPYGQPNPYGQQSPDPAQAPPEWAQEVLAQNEQLTQAYAALVADAVGRQTEELLGSYSDLDTGEGAEEVDRRLSALEAHGVDVQNPAVLGQVFEAARAALTSEDQGQPVPPDQARNQGATLETNAGAAIDGAPSEEDKWWEQVRGAGGSAFGD